jgi:serralysin
MADVFTLHFTGDQEVPPTGSEATGTGTVHWDGSAGAAAYEYTVSGLDFGPVLGLEPQTETTADDVTIMHVHNAPPGVSGPIVFGLIGPAQDTDDLSIVLNDDGSWTVSGAWEVTDPANVSIETFAEALDAASAGEDVPLYFNVHTVTFPAGEIRAQWVAEADLAVVTEEVPDRYESTDPWFCV